MLAWLLLRLLATAIYHSLERSWWRGVTAAPTAVLPRGETAGVALNPLLSLSFLSRSLPLSSIAGAFIAHYILRHLIVSTARVPGWLVSGGSVFIATHYF
jgi:hypothetical protein